MSFPVSLSHSIQFFLDFRPTEKDGPGPDFRRNTFWTVPERGRLTLIQGEGERKFSSLEIEYQEPDSIRSTNKKREGLIDPSLPIIRISAERQGFEPWEQLPVHRISSAARSTTPASFQSGCKDNKIVANRLSLNYNFYFCTMSGGRPSGESGSGPYPAAARPGIKKKGFTETLLSVRRIRSCLYNLFAGLSLFKKCRSGEFYWP